jgi:hypothetical protein
LLVGSDKVGGGMSTGPLSLTIRSPGARPGDNLVQVGIGGPKSSMRGGLDPLYGPCTREDLAGARRQYARCGQNLEAAARNGSPHRPTPNARNPLSGKRLPIIKLTLFSAVGKQAAKRAWLYRPRASEHPRDAGHRNVGRGGHVIDSKRCVAYVIHLHLGGANVAQLYT